MINTSVKTQLNKSFSIACTLLIGAIFSSAIAASTMPQKAKVMMLGTFHFSSPGKDTIKISHTDVMTAENQKYLTSLSQRITEQFRPTHVLVECPPESQDLYEEQYEDYKKGTFELPVNEVYQIGFRVAANSPDSRIVCFDERNTPWQAEQLFEDMKQSPEIQAAMDELIKRMTEEGNRRHANNTLAEILHIMNSDELDHNNKYSYLMTNEIGAFGNFSGADAAASWWHRNFRMYANIQHFAQQGTRILVLAGQGHTAIMKDLLAEDSRREAVDIKAFL